MPYKKVTLTGSLSSVRRQLWKDGRLLSFGFFLLVSTALWTLNKFSASYTYELPAQIELVTPNPASYTMGARSVTEAQLRVRASGHDIMRYKMFVSKKFRVPIAPTERNVNNTSAVATAQLRNAIAQQLGASYELQAIWPDSITFELSRVDAKKVPVRSGFRTSYAPQYMQHGAVLFTPDSVTVSGAEGALHGVCEVYTEPLVKERLNAKQTGRVDLVAPPQVYLSHRRVAYSIDVQRFVEVSYELPIYVLGTPDTLSVAVLPATARVTFSVAMEKCHELRREELHLTVSYGELRNSISDRLYVQLNNPPDYVLSTTIAPSFVHVISMSRP